LDDELADQDKRLDVVRKSVDNKTKNHITFEILFLKGWLIYDYAFAKYLGQPKDFTDTAQQTLLDKLETKLGKRLKKYKDMPHEHM